MSNEELKKEEKDIEEEEEEEENEEEEYHTDRLAIAPKQTVACDVCKKEYNTTEKACFFCFPPFGLDISQYRIVACDSCWHRIRWDVDSQTNEILLFLTKENDKDT